MTTTLVLRHMMIHTVDVVHHLRGCPGAGSEQGAALPRRARMQQQSRQEAGCLSALLPQPEPETAAAAAAAEYLDLLLLLLLQQILELHVQQRFKTTKKDHESICSHDDGCGTTAHIEQDTMC